MKGEPRVLWMTDEFPPEFGGTGMMALQLSQGLIEQGLPVEVVTRQIIPHVAEREYLGKVSVQRIQPAGRLKGAGWRAVPLLLFYLARLVVLLIARWRRFDVAIISGMKIIPLAAVPVCRLLGKKCVIRVESPFEIQEPISSESLTSMGGGASKLMRLLALAQGAVLRRADRIIAISTEIESLVKQRQTESNRVTKIPNTVDLTKFRPVSDADKARIRVELGIGPNRTVVVNVGRITRSKGMLALMSAWPEIVERHPEALLVVVGQGSGYWDDCEREVAEIIQKYHLQGHVLLVGQSNQANRFFQAADLFVSPSEYEGFALTLVEALACGLPCVSTTVGEAPQLIRNGVNGFLCAPKNTDDLRAKLELAFEHRATWGDMARQACESVVEFDQPRISARYAGLCRELCSVTSLGSINASAAPH